MSLAGMELNSTHASAVSGPDGVAPMALLLDGEATDLPMAISIEHRRPEVGRAGASLCRQYPHLACLDFLPVLGTSQTWGSRRRRLDAAKALALIFDHLRPALVGINALVVAVPSYLTTAQVHLLLPAARKARLPIVGSASSSLAAALAAHAERPLTGLVLLIDADDHALSWSLLKFGQEKAQVVGSKSLPYLGLRVWKGCLLDAIADSCIHQSRRDPRDSGAAEQLLYDQLDDVLEVSRRDEMVEVVIRAANWCQNLILQPQQVRAYCSPLVAESIEEIRAVVAEAPDSYPGVVLLTAAAAQLPGLAGALHHETPEAVPVISLAGDAAARGAHALAARIQRGELPRGHLEGAVPLARSELSSTAAAGRRVISITSIAGRK